MGKLKVNNTTTDEVYFVPCIECGGDDDDIIFTNEGNSTFNTGSVQCRKCKNITYISHILWNAPDASMIPEWNADNDIKIIIQKLENKIGEYQAKLDKYKLKL